MIRGTNPRANKLFSLLRARLGPAQGPTRTSPFRVLVGLILSQRTRDETTTMAAERLFSVIRTPRDLARLPLRRVETIIRRSNFHKTKARKLKALARVLRDRYHGKVPRDRRILLELPGVGPKTAEGVLAFAFGRFGIVVDTHVARVAKRTGLVPENAKPESIASAIRHDLSPKKAYSIGRYLWAIGKNWCASQKPKCLPCPANPICLYYREHPVRT